MSAGELLIPGSEALRRRGGGEVRALGIDLGTTNSTVAEAWWRPGEAEPLSVRCIEVEQPTAEGSYVHILLPSVVAITAGGVLVGEGAKRARARAAEERLDQGRSLFFDCKNDMGLARTYHRAPEGFRSAPEIGARVLAALARAAREEDETPAARTVVTVPASFQVAQRRDTRAAAEGAGIEVGPGDLLDEPTAAFLDWVLRHPDEPLAVASRPVNLVVFDFGGGTCDVAVFAVSPGQGDAPLNVSPRAVSRYHRLGGGDVDAAIVHEVLIPELMEQNGIPLFGLGFEDKKKVLEPALLGLAENLKISLCTEIGRLERFGKYAEADKDAIHARSPVTHECLLRGRALRLDHPTLTAARFEQVLAPFLDTDLLFAQEGEYRTTCSIFSPLTDALERSGLEPEQVDVCLLVGGSSLIPQVQAAVRGRFPSARLLTYESRDEVQSAVARGAALHALSLALVGHGAVKTVTHEAISLRTASRLLELVPAGAELPWPGALPARRDGLAVPRSSAAKPVELRVELVAGSGEDEAPLFRAVWQLPAPVTRGEPLVAELRMDENQILELRLALASSPGQVFEAVIENPLTHVANPRQARLELEAIEEAVRTGRVPKEKVPDELAKAANLMAELGQRERALEQLAKVLRAKNSPDAWILNRMAMIAGELGDAAREEKLYREAFAADPQWSGPLFNLALAHRKRGRLEDAAAVVREAVETEARGPHLVLAAQIADARKRPEEGAAALARGLGLFPSPGACNDWELAWLVAGAQMAGEDEILDAARGEQAARARKRGAAGEPGGELPLLEGGLART